MTGGDGTPGLYRGPTAPEGSDVAPPMPKKQPLEARRRARNMQSAMGFGERQHRAVRKIRAARDEIIQVAARMQSAGTDTTELTPPLVEIQEALSELESSWAPGSAEVTPSHRGRMS